VSGEIKANTPDFDGFFETDLPKYDLLTSMVSSIMEKVIVQSGVEYLSVTGRTKDKISIIEKIERKHYSNFTMQMTDISGIRIITFLDSQVQKISELIRQTFSIDDENSLDRGKILGDDKLGYRSVHFVGTLSSDRNKFLEYRGLCDLKFEIQIRTVLQHAWAELAHDRSYKFKWALPSHLQRQLNLYSDMLEVVDNAFDDIAESIDKYQGEVQREDTDTLSQETINTISLKEFLRGSTINMKSNIVERP